jgi:hypothetical protein
MHTATKIDSQAKIPTAKNPAHTRRLSRIISSPPCFRAMNKNPNSSEYMGNSAPRKNEANNASDNFPNCPRLFLKINARPVLAEVFCNT